MKFIKQILKRFGIFLTLKDAVEEINKHRSSSKDYYVVSSVKGILGIFYVKIQKATYCKFEEFKLSK